MASNALTNHLLSRHVDLTLHRPIIDEANGVATFLLYDLSGRIVGYQQYRPSSDKRRHNDPRLSRYFTRCGGYDSKYCVFGMESLHLTPRLVFITEGIFDCVRITRRGVSAVAVLTNSPCQSLQTLFKILPQTKVVICDNDDNRAGDKLRVLASSVNHIHYTDAKDLGDSSEDYLTRLLERYYDEM